MLEVSGRGTACSFPAAFPMSELFPATVASVEARGFTVDDDVAVDGTGAAGAAVGVLAGSIEGVVGAMVVLATGSSAGRAGRGLSTALAVDDLYADRVPDTGLAAPTAVDE